jgi:hypothetical protein
MLKKLAQQIEFLSYYPFLIEDGSRIQLRSRYFVIIKDEQWTKSKRTILLIITHHHQNLLNTAATMVELKNICRVENLSVHQYVTLHVLQLKTAQGKPLVYNNIIFGKHVTKTQA